ncbi:MAG: beta strand repeat-containing protein, partial [Planctomycetota bacterium]
MTIASDGTTYTLGGAITGTTSFAVASVNRISLSASGNSTSQQMTFQGGTAFSLSSGLTSTGVDTIDFNQSLSTGSANISVTAPRNISVYPSRTLSTTSGSITLYANLGGGAPGSFYGVNIDQGSITTTGGDIEIVGRGGDGSTSAVGVQINQATVTSSGGNVTVIGIGGGSASSTLGNAGVFITGGTTINGGIVTVTGTGGTGDTSPAFGVLLNTSSTVSGSGSVSVTGTGGVTNANSNYGVYVTNGSTISSSAGAAVVVSGTGGGSASSDENIGIVVRNDGGGAGSIASSGTLTLTGIGGNVGSSALTRGIQITGGGTASTTNNSIALNADSVSLDTAGSTINAGSGTVTFAPITAGTAINLGTAAASSIGLTDAQLDTVTAGQIVIGST